MDVCNVFSYNDTLNGYNYNYIYTRIIQYLQKIFSTSIISFFINKTHPQSYLSHDRNLSK